MELNLIHPPGDRRGAGAVAAAGRAHPEHALARDEETLEQLTNRGRRFNKKVLTQQTLNLVIVRLT